MCFGGGGGDDGAAEARRAEEERRARISAGTRNINRAFDGGYYGTNPATAYDPSAAYYTDFGDAWSPAAPIYVHGQQTGGTEGEASIYEQILSNPADQQASDLIKSGRLFTSKEQRPGFDDDFYSGFRKSYTDFYLPRVDEQYDNAKRKTTYRLANAGGLDSSSGNTQIANLFRDYNRERAQIGDQAIGAEQDLRNQVEQNRSEIISQLNATANPESAAATSLARAKALSTPQPFKPLSDLFQQYTGALATSHYLEGEEGGGYKGLGVRDWIKKNGPSQRTIW